MKLFSLANFYRVSKTITEINFHCSSFPNSIYFSFLSYQFIFYSFSAKSDAKLDRRTENSMERHPERAGSAPIFRFLIRHQEQKALFVAL
jgi:hypothetical protein